MEKLGSKLSNPIEDRNRTFIWRIRMITVKDTLRRIKTGKARPDEIRIKVWKYLGNVSVEWLRNPFNEIVSINKIPSELRKMGSAECNCWTSSLSWVMSASQESELEVAWPNGVEVVCGCGCVHYATINDMIHIIWLAIFHPTVWLNMNGLTKVITLFVTTSTSTRTTTKTTTFTETTTRITTTSIAID